MSSHRKIVFTLALFLLGILHVNFCYAQARPAYDEETTIEEVKSQLAQMCAEAGELRVFCSENNISGQFVYDITLEGKGTVLTIFLVSSTTEQIQVRNALKDKLYSLQFENIKIPKKERVKFRYTLNF